MNQKTLISTKYRIGGISECFLKTPSDPQPRQFRTSRDCPGMIDDLFEVSNRKRNNFDQDEEVNKCFE